MRFLNDLLRNGYRPPQSLVLVDLFWVLCFQKHDFGLIYILFTKELRNSRIATPVPRALATSKH
ncbi:hypothetical protein NIES4071_11990 [Calothrix sp. NIES-4071]|nr:hypothetical protein NIES4071_11990 [Calothrix sp. NIES-4071]BAZ55539.1 hypothetical protein NIES4105_11950 [Calothrix sp. NIES-4105]